jgi:predicted Zn-dependent peptidase
MFQKSYLSNGMPVVMERVSNFRSVSMGIWVRVGSRMEVKGENGISHFLEHMLFKGTSKRSVSDIAIDIDALGGELNAFTSKEGTTFYIKVLDEFIEEGMELLSDLFLNSTFPEEEVEREKDVVIEEIKMVHDTPDDYIHDLFAQSIWGTGGLGQPILGKRDTVSSFSREDLKEHVRQFYGASGTVMACAGNFEHGKLLDLLENKLGTAPRDAMTVACNPQKFRTRTSVHRRDLSEVHLCMGIKGIEQASPHRYATLLLNTIFGGGISSRLFQEIREKRGLAYTVYSYLSSYLDNGLWGIYVGTGKKKLNEVISRSAEELMNFHRTLTEEELERAKTHLKGSIMLGLESTSRRMQNIATQERYYGKYFSPREILKKIDAVSYEEAVSLAESLVSDSGISLTVLGPVERSDIKADIPGH